MIDYIKKEDYEEPCCPFDLHPEKVRIPVDRVIEKLDSYLDRNDYLSAERHLRYWAEEAKAGCDRRGLLTVLNEQIGLYRKIGRENECIEAIENALSLADKMEIEDTVTFGTTLVNAATGYKAFEKAEKALSLYKKARAVYENLLDPFDSKLGGLYNNMALALAELHDFRQTEELYFKAIEIMSRQKNGELETAITYLNLADLVSVEKGFEDGEEQINKYVNKAEELLNTESLPRDGYYAFVCEKCAPVFGYYGYFFLQNELEKRAREIYERA